jgi:hypothetical protein
MNRTEPATQASEKEYPLEIIGKSIPLSWHFKLLSVLVQDMKSAQNYDSHMLFEILRELHTIFVVEHV